MRTAVEATRRWRRPAINRAGMKYLRLRSILIRGAKLLQDNKLSHNIARDKI